MILLFEVDMSEKTKFLATVAKVQTLADNGIRLWLDLPESAIVQMAELAAYQVHGVVLSVVAEKHEIGENEPEKDETRRSKLKY